MLAKSSGQAGRSIGDGHRGKRYFSNLPRYRTSYAVITPRASPRRNHDDGISPRMAIRMRDALVWVGRARQGGAEKGTVTETP